MTPSRRHPVPPAVRKTSLTTAALFLSMAVVSPSLDRLVREPFPGEERGAMWFMIAHSASQLLLLGMLAGMLSDRIGKRIPLIAVGLVGTGIATALLPLIPDFPALLALRFFDGLFGTVAISLLMARVVDLSTDENRARCMAMLMAAIPFGYLAGMVLMALIGDMSLAVSFAVSGGLVVACGLWFLRDWSEPSMPHRARGSAADAVRDVPKLWMPILFGFVDKMTFAAIAMLTSLAVADIWGRSDVRSSGLAMAGFWIAFIAFVRPAARLAERLGTMTTIAAGSVLYGAALAGLAFGSFAQFAALMALCGALTGLRFVPIMTLVGDLSAPGRRATNMGAFNLAGSVGIIAGFAVAGILSSVAGYARTFAVFGAMELVCAAVAGVYLLLVPAARRGGRTRTPDVDSALNSERRAETLAQVP